MMKSEKIFEISPVPEKEWILNEVTRQLIELSPHRYSVLLRSFVPRTVGYARDDGVLARALEIWLAQVLKVAPELTVEAWVIRLINQAPMYITIDLCYFNHGWNAWLSFYIGRLKGGGYHMQYDGRRTIHELPELWEAALRGEYQDIDEI